MEKSFSDLKCAAKKKLTWCDQFLTEIDSVTPWANGTTSLTLAPEG